MEISTDEIASVRPILCEQGLLSRPDGSATYCQGDTVIMAAVYGPTEVRIQKESAIEANVDIIYKPKIGLPSCSEKLQEHLIKNTCKSAILITQHPRTNITIVLQELQNRGSILSCCINAACLALIDSGLQMKYLFAAVSCVLDSDEVTVDPALDKESSSRASFFFVFENRNFSIISSYSEGTFDQGEYQKCLSLCRDVSKKIFDFYRDTVKRKYVKFT